MTISEKKNAYSDTSFVSNSKQNSLLMKDGHPRFNCLMLALDHGEMLSKRKGDDLREEDDADMPISKEEKKTMPI